jgi:ferrous iron transport protein B
MKQIAGSAYRGPVEYSVEIALERIGNLLSHDYGLSTRSIGLLLLQEDAEIAELVRENEPDHLARIGEIIKEVKAHYRHPIEYEIALERQEEVTRIVRKVLRKRQERRSFAETVSRLTMNPLTGIPVLLLVLYFGLYQFVGSFGAGTVVGFLEGTIFERYINPYVIRTVSSVIPWNTVRELIAGQYGIITLGVRYAVALILPIVTLFFIVFAIIEDSGYLPRLAMLIDRVFKGIGLTGRAVIPMVLGLGCATMATMVTRTLPTRRERVIATMLLSLAVPCSAQLGVILALLEGEPRAMLIWGGVIGSVFVFIGYLTAKIMPGERPSFYMELPPLRFPQLSNVLIKTYVRVKWYFKEILPLFILASVIIWMGQITGLFDLIVGLLRNPVAWIGLPPEAAKIFLFGFLRRDYGAAGLYDLNKGGYLNGRQLVVSCVALTLFLPCLAQFLITARERGWKTALSIASFVLLFSFTTAYALNMVLQRSGVAL